MPRILQLQRHSLLRILTWSSVLALATVCVAQQTPAESEPTPKTAPQVEQVLPSYEGQNVTSLELAGQPDLNTKDLGRLLTQRAGEPFSKTKVDESVKALEQQGGFKNVELEIRPEANGVRVLFVLQPAIYFGMYEFPGALGNYSYSRLLQVANYPPRGAYTPVDVNNAQAALEKYFKRTGYFLATVEPEVRTDKTYGIANVFFHVKLNKRAKFGNVEFQGATPQETARLQHTLKTFIARFRGSAIRPGKPYHLKTVQNATQYLQSTLMKQGYLGAQVKMVGAAYDPNTNRADLSFSVQQGPLVHVKVLGAHLWSWNRKKLLPIYAQIGVDPELIQEGRTNLVSFFQSKGYFDTKVTVNVDQQPSAETITYNIDRGPRHKVDAVSIAGNQHITTKELMGHVTVQKGHLLSHGKYSEKLVRGSAKNLTAVYQADGFSTVKVTPQVTKKNGNEVVTFNVDEGPQDMVESLVIQGNTVPMSQLVPKGLKVTAGQPYSQKHVDDDRNEIVAHYLDMGYLTATFRETATTVGGDKHRLQVVYHIMEGPQVTTDNVVIMGRKVTKQAVIAKATQIPTKKPLKESDLLLSESKLYTLGIFDWASVDPRRQITTQNQEEVVVKVHEAKRNTITYGFGFEVINRGGSIPSGTVAVPGVPPVGLPSNFKTSQQTFYGPRGTFQYTRNNFRGRAESLSFSGFAGRLDQRGAIAYTNPSFRMTRWSTSATLTGEHDSQNPIFTSRMAQAGYQFQHPLNKDRTTNVFFRYSFQETGLTRLLIPDLIPSQDLHVRLSTVSATYTRDTRDNALDARKGIYETAEFDLNPSALGSNVNFDRFQGQAAYYKNIGGGIIWANSLRLGLAKAFVNSHVPISEEFFSGGGSTLRGFSLNGAGPQHAIEICGTPGNSATCATTVVPTGGRMLAIVNTEFRIPVNYDLPLVGKHLGFAAFYDGGNIYSSVNFSNFADNYTHSVGVGLRYATPVGPVRIDIGHLLNPPAVQAGNTSSTAGIKSTQLFITLGQAF